MHTVKLGISIIFDVIQSESSATSKRNCVAAFTRSMNTGRDMEQCGERITRTVSQSGLYRQRQSDPAYFLLH